MRKAKVGLPVTILSRSKTGWAQELRDILSDVPYLEPVVQSNSEDLGSVVFIDENYPGRQKFLKGVERKSRAFFLVVQDGDEIPDDLIHEAVDDVLVYPFRKLEILSKLKLYQQVLMWSEVNEVNDSFHDLIERLRSDLELASRLQISRSPNRFSKLKGLQVRSRYIAGMRSGGDFFDVMSSPSGARISMVLTDSSTYGLSSAVLMSFTEIALKVAAGGGLETTQAFQAVSDSISKTLQDKDRLSLFFANFNREDLSMRYLNYGKSMIYHAESGGKFHALPRHGDEIHKLLNGKKPAEEKCIELNPSDRVVILSDGVLEEIGSESLISGWLDATREESVDAVLNELVFQVKDRLKKIGKTRPEQDCTFTVGDVSSNVFRMKKVSGVG